MAEQKILLRSFYDPSGFNKHSIDTLLNCITDLVCEVDPEVTAGVNVISHGEHAEVVVTIFDCSLSPYDIQEAVEEMGKDKLKKHNIIFIKE